MKNLGKNILTISDNPVNKAILTGLITAAGIAATTAFAPVGVVGATGWYVVYGNSAATLLWETGKYLKKKPSKK